MPIRTATCPERLMESRSASQAQLYHRVPVPEFHRAVAQAVDSAVLQCRKTGLPVEAVTDPIDGKFNFSGQ